MPRPAPTPALRRYAELVRVSTAIQAERDTPEDQRRALDALRLSRPGVLVERIDSAISGAKDSDDRADLSRLFALLAQGKVDELRVRHVDRVTRHPDPRQRAAVLGALMDAQAVVVETSGRVIDPADEMGELDFTLQGWIASRERRRILERTMAAKRRLAAEGRLVSSTPPWGRTWDKERGWGTDPDALATYRRLIDMVIRGRSLRQVAEDLNAEGVSTCRGRPWTAGTVYNAITAPHVTGRWRSHGAEARIPPVVDEATQAAAIARLHANDLGGGRRVPHPALLRKLLVCGRCSAPVHTDRSDARLYYYCAGACGRRGNSHRADIVDETVRAAVEAWLERPTPLAAAARTDRPADDAASARKDAAEARRELKDLDRQEDNLLRFLRRGIGTRRAHEKQMEEVARLRAAAKRELADAEARIESAARRAEFAAELAAKIQGIRDGLKSSSFAEWRAALEILFPRAAGYCVALWPDGKFELRGAVSLDASGEATLAHAGRRELSPPSRRSGQFPLRFTAALPRRGR